MADIDIKYLDLAGLTAYDKLIHKEIVDGDAKVLKAIDDLDSSVAATAETDNRYSVLTGVTQTDGKLTDKAEVLLAAVAKTGAAADVANDAIAASDTKVAVTGDNIHDQIDSIATTLKSVQANAAKYIVREVGPAEMSEKLNPNVKEAYKVMLYVGDYDETTATQVGEYIKIYKDSALVDFKLGHVDDKLQGTTSLDDEAESSTIVPGTGETALVYVMQLANGKYKIATVNVQDFLEESEFGDGLKVDNHVVSLKLDTSGDDTGDGKFLSITTGANGGLKLDGVTDAINTAKDEITGEDTDTSDDLTLKGLKKAIEETGAAATTTITEVPADSPVPSGGNAKIVIKKSTPTAEDGHINYVIEGQDLASAIALGLEENRAKTAEKTLADSVGCEVNASGVISAYTSTTGNKFATKNKVKDDIDALDAELARYTPITVAEINAMFNDNRKEETPESGN